MPFCLLWGLAPFCCCCCFYYYYCCCCCCCFSFHRGGSRGCYKSSSNSTVDQVRASPSYAVSFGCIGISPTAVCTSSCCCLLRVAADCRFLLLLLLLLAAASCCSCKSLSFSFKLSHLSFLYLFYNLFTPATTTTTTKQQEQQQRSNNSSSSSSSRSSSRSKMDGRTAGWASEGSHGHSLEPSLLPTLLGLHITAWDALRLFPCLLWSLLAIVCAVVFLQYPIVHGR